MGDDTWNDADSMPQDVRIRARRDGLYSVSFPAAMCRGVRRDDDEESDVWMSSAILDPPLLLPWRYTPHQYHLPTWHCSAIYVHDERGANERDESGRVCDSEVWERVGRAVAEIARDKEGPLQFKLLINPDGVPCDRARVGTDLVAPDTHGVEVAFSVRRGPNGSLAAAGAADRAPPSATMYLFAVVCRRGPAYGSKTSTISDLPSSSTAIR